MELAYSLVPPVKAFYTDPAWMSLILSTTRDEDKEKLQNKFDQTVDNQQADYLLYVLHTEGIGMESGRFASWLHDIYVLMRRVTIRVYRLTRNMVEHFSKNYTLFISLWKNKIEKNLAKIDEEHFENMEVKAVSFEILKRRISVIGKIAQVINNIGSVINAPIHDMDNNEGYDVPIFIELYKDIKAIGFSIANKTFTESRSQGYNAQLEKMTLKAHGYSKSDLTDLVNLANDIARYATKKWETQTVKNFVNINKGLTTVEKNTMTNKSPEEHEKKEKLKKIDIRISRLWWFSNLIHLLTELTEDQMKIMLNIFRAAEGSIPIASSEETEDSPGTKYF